MAATVRGRWLQVSAGAGLVGFVALAYVHAASEAEARAKRDEHRPVEQRGDGYVSSRECRACHPTQYQSWSHSYHSTMTRPATPEHVFGDFGGVELQQGDTRVHLRRDGDRFVATASPPANYEGPATLQALPPGDHEIALVTGSHHMQVYWFETGQSRKLDPFPFAYLKEDARWIPRRMAFLRPPSDFRSGETGRWNADCIHCHTTHGQPRTEQDGSFDTRVAEFGIACEACHGPAARHVRRHSAPLSRYARRIGAASDNGDDTIVNPSRLDHRRASEICSQCHALWQFERDAYARWMKDGYAYRPGDDPDDTMWLFAPSRAGEDERVAQVLNSQPAYALGQFWSDGQARVSGREFHGMADSACFERGEISCMSCHSMHQQREDRRAPARWADDQLGTGMETDRACLQCHEDYTRDLAAHTHHPPESDGSRCYNCHMPYTSYGLLKAIRAHQITVPSAGETLRTGRPNACNACHLDKSLGWTADHLQTRYGLEPPALSPDQRELASSVLLALEGDAGQRALTAWALGWEPARRASGERWVAPFLGLLMDDPYDAVRYIAGRSLRALPGVERFEYDFVIAPHARAPVAPQVAQAARAGGEIDAIPASVPLQASGRPDRAVVDRLLSRRDHRPVNLLE